MNIWARLGISVAVIGVYCILLNEVFASKTFYELYRWQFCIALAFAGKAFWVIGRFLNKNELKVATPDGKHTNGADPEYEEVGAPAKPGASFRYWGVMLLIMAGLVVVIVPERPVVVAAKTLSETNNSPTATNASRPVQKIEKIAPPPPTFPEAKLQGIGFSNGRASALIDGRTYLAGEYVDGARIARIDSNGIVLELDGHFKLVSFEKDYLR